MTEMRTFTDADNRYSTRALKTDPVGATEHHESKHGTAEMSDVHLHEDVNGIGKDTALDYALPGLVRCPMP